jgi:hypothetical protein
MAINLTFYLDAADLASAVSVYLDFNLVNLAPDGFYSDSTIVRQQSSGVLLEATICEECLPPCGGVISVSGGEGIYLLEIGLGSTSSDVGAVIIRFDPSSVPDGIRAIYDSVVYNKLSSPVDGVHQSATPGNFTIIGNVNATSGCSASWYPSGGSVIVDEYLYDGTSFNLTGNSQTIAIDSNDLSLGDPPGDSIMVIPKLNGTPNIINIQVLGPCSSTGWDINISCPALLPSFSSSQMQANPNIGCMKDINQTFYFAKVHLASDTFVGLYDYVFADAYGQFSLADGYYLTDNVASPNKTLEVLNGIVVSITDCI